MDCSYCTEISDGAFAGSGYSLSVVVQPHQSLEEDKPHDGEEFGYLISGRLKLYLGEEVYSVKAGESFYYPAKRKHHIENPDIIPAKFIWVSTPPTF